MVRGRLVGVLVGLVALVAAPVAFLAVTAGTASATVVSDEASFRAALANAAETTITFSANITISTCGTAPTRNSSTDVAIDGAGFTLTQTCAGVDAIQQDGSGALNISNLTISGGGEGVDSAGPVSLTSSTITGVTNTSDDGIAIVADGDVTLTSSTITNTTATANSFSAQGIDARGNVTLTNSTISGTVASTGDGEALGIDCDGSVAMTGSSITGTAANDDDGEALAIDCNGDVTMTGSSIANTTSSGDEALGIDTDDAVSMTDSQITATQGGNEAFGIDTDGAVTMVRSTIAGTTASEFVDAIDNDDTVSLTNSTITGNAGHAIDGGGAVTLVYSDVVGNGGQVEQGSVPAASSNDPHHQGVSGSAAGPHGAAAVADAQIQQNGESLTTFASVIAQPQAGFVNCSGSPAPTSEGYNFADDTTCNLTNTGDQQGAGLNPQLGSLADNGGPTLTLLPATTSPLVDGVAIGACSSDGASGISPLTDQRGLPRPQFAGCDIGSVELQPAPAPPAPPAPPVIIQPAFTG
jgi:hypothetical protein